jgi:hypothetical protein
MTTSTKTFSPLIVIRSGLGLELKRVHVSDKCPRCGGQRGESFNYHFSEDGDFYNCSRWNNPCGHVDSYKDVYEEHLLLNSDIDKENFETVPYEEYALPKNTVAIVGGEMQILPSGTEVIMFGHTKKGNMILKGFLKGKEIFMHYYKELFNVKNRLTQCHI